MLSFGEKVIEIAEKYGFEIETKPIEGAKHNRSKEQYLIDLAMEKLAEAEEREKELDEREKELQELLEKTEGLYQQVSAAVQAGFRPAMEELRRLVPAKPDQQSQPDDTGPDF